MKKSSIFSSSSSSPSKGGLAIDTRSPAADDPRSRSRSSAIISPRMASASMSMTTPRGTEETGTRFSILVSTPSHSKMPAMTRQKTRDDMTTQGTLPEIKSAAVKVSESGRSLSDGVMIRVQSHPEETLEVVGAGMEDLSDNEGDDDEGGGKLDLSWTTITSAEKVEFYRKLWSDSGRVKKYCRNGIPNSDRRHLWQILAGVKETEQRSAQEKYREILKDIFIDGRMPDYFHRYVPDFGNPVSWSSHETFCKVDQDTQHILCALAKTNPGLSFCPYIVDLIPIFLSHNLTDYECFHLCQTLIDASRRNGKYFSITGKGFEGKVATFGNYVISKTKKIYKVMLSLGVDPCRFFRNWLMRFFVSFLPQIFISRILDCYLMEGYKIFYRVGLGLFAYYYPRLKNCKTRLEFEQRFSWLALNSENEVDEILKTGFNLRGIARRDMLKLKTQAEEKVVRSPAARITVFHVPRFIGGDSEIVNDQQLYLLWHWLPDALRAYDATLLYKSSRDGYRLDTMMAKLGSESKPHIILIQDTKKAIFGGLFHQKWKKLGPKDNQLADGEDCVFSLHPHQEMYFNQCFVESSLSKARLFMPTLHLSVKRGRNLSIACSPDHLRIVVMDDQAHTLVIRKIPLSLTSSPEIKVEADLHKFIPLEMRCGTKTLRIELWGKKAKAGTRSDVLIGEIEWELDKKENEKVDGWFSILERGENGVLTTKRLGDLELALTYCSANGKEERHRKKKLQREKEAEEKEEKDSKESKESKDKKEGSDDEDDIRGCYLSYNSEGLALYDADGIVFSLNHTLKQGKSTSTTAFNNPPLSFTEDTEGDFEVSEVELWGFHQGF